MTPDTYRRVISDADAKALAERNAERAREAIERMGRRHVYHPETTAPRLVNLRKQQ